MTSKKLYEYPIEYRIRLKYILFGIIMGITFMSMYIMSIFISNVVMKYFNIFPSNYGTTISYDYNIVISFGVILVACSLLLYVMWYSKKPSKSIEQEPMGLKYDYDRVKET